MIDDNKGKRSIAGGFVDDDLESHCLAVLAEPCSEHDRLPLASANPRASRRQFSEARSFRFGTAANLPALVGCCDRTCCGQLIGCSEISAEGYRRTIRSRARPGPAALDFEFRQIAP